MKYFEELAEQRSKRQPQLREVLFPTVYQNRQVVLSNSRVFWPRMAKKCSRQYLLKRRGGRSRFERTPLTPSLLARRLARRWRPANRGRDHRAAERRRLRGAPRTNRRVAAAAMRVASTSVPDLMMRPRATNWRLASRLRQPGLSIVSDRECSGVSRSSGMRQKRRNDRQSRAASSGGQRVCSTAVKE
jgi:hypothetical protein